MSQTPMTLQTPLAHKAFAWRRWLMILIGATLLSGSLWWAKETGRLDSWLDSTTVKSTITTSVAGDGVAQEQAVAPLSATNNTTRVQSSTAANDTTTASSQPMATTTDQATQPASSNTNTTANTKAVAVVAVSRSLVAVAGIAGVQLWNAEGQPLTTLDIGAKLQATARTADGQWLMVETAEGNGWAQAAQVVAFDLAELPVTDRAAPTITASAPSDAASISAASSTTTASTQPVVSTETQAPSTSVTNAQATDATTATAVTAIVATSGANLNVRSGPSTSDDLITKIANGAIVTVSGRNESSVWLQIDLSANTADTGWVAAQYLQLDSPIDSLPVMAIASN